MAVLSKTPKATVTCHSRRWAFGDHRAGGCALAEKPVSPLVSQIFQIHRLFTSVQHFFFSPKPAAIDTKSLDKEQGLTKGSSRTPGKATGRCHLASNAVKGANNQQKSRESHKKSKTTAMFFLHSYMHRIHMTYMYSYTSSIAIHRMS